MNFRVIIHCFLVSCTKMNHSLCPFVIWSLQLTSIQWIITQQFNARADLFLNYKHTFLCLLSHIFHQYKPCILSLAIEYDSSPRSDVLECGIWIDNLHPSQHFISHVGKFFRIEPGLITGIKCLALGNNTTPVVGQSPACYLMVTSSALYKMSYFYGIWLGSLLFAYRILPPDSPKMESGLIHLIRMGKCIRLIWLMDSIIVPRHEKICLQGFR